MKKIFPFLFILSVIGVLSGILLHEKWLDFVYKPLIMISLGGLFFTQADNLDFKTRQFAAWAFLFSLAGDIFLMLSANQLFFMAGLGSFLIAQIGYIFSFQNSNIISGTKSYIRKNPFWLILYLIYGGSVYWLLFPNLDPVLKIAVFVYMIALLGMSVMALNRKGIKPEKSFLFVFAGSVLFMISDSVIAINKFFQPVPFDRLIVMSTYMAAQFLIVKGLVFQYKEKG